ncbi:MAG TPA: hypothetical protein VIH76_03240 [Candidatus Acidoferrales bacterium]
MGVPVNGGTRTPISSGMCLHIAQNGKRCARPALFSGFCQRHDPQAAPTPRMPIARMAAAVLLLMVFLWPLVADLLREIGRWMH